MRVLVVSHGHPGESPSGAEHAAYELFKALRARRDLEAFFAARTTVRRHDTTAFASWEGRADEVLFYSEKIDWFLHSLQSRDQLFEWETLLERLRPDVVHFHHYAGIGVELIALVRRALPSCRIVVTLHEFLAVCHHHGQMVRTGTYELCDKPSAVRCSQCFPERTPSDFAMRRLFLLSRFEAVDWFIAPSSFLRERYVDWGLPAARVVVIENYVPTMPRLPPRQLRSGQQRNRFGYFGTIGVFKGIRVLIEGFENLLLMDSGRAAELVLHGMLGFAPEDFRKWFDTALTRNAGHIRWIGRYSREDLPRLMADIDWVVMPSIWWENSPLVIQEAKMLGRPIICSGIGGMREKISDGSGLLFETGNSASLAVTMSSGVAQFDEFQERLVASSMSDNIEDIISLYHLDSSDVYVSSRTTSAILKEDPTDINA